MIILILSALCLLSGVLTILEEHRGKYSAAQFLRVLTMLSIIGIAFLGERGSGRPYQTAIVCGLLFSLAGDVFMMQKRKRFTAGLLMFLIAQILYTVAFFSGLRPGFSLWPVIPLSVYAVLIVRILYRRLGKMKIPIMIYVAVIMVMARTATERYLQLQSTAALLAMIGAIFFLFSDSTLALNRFVRPFRGAQAIILSTYFLAQYLISMSV